MRDRSIPGYVALLALVGGEALAEAGDTRPTPRRESMAALARDAQNPLANIISLPFQNDTNLNAGPRGGTQNILNIQPVIPVRLNADWNLITRTVLPVTSQPSAEPGQGTVFGLGAAQASFFAAPSDPGALIWGVGAIVQVPTTTDPALGSSVWGVGPTLVGLTMQGPWVLGNILSNVWSAGGDGRSRYNQFKSQPLVNYNFPQSPGTYLSFSPIITADWDAPGGQRWTVPLGLALGQVLPVGKQPINVQLGAYYNVIRPDNAPDWQLRFQLAFLFPQ